MAARAEALRGGAAYLDSPKGASAKKKAPAGASKVSTAPTRQSCRRADAEWEPLFPFQEKGGGAAREKMTERYKARLHCSLPGQKKTGRTLLVARALRLLTLHLRESFCLATPSFPVGGSVVAGGQGYSGGALLNPFGLLVLLWRRPLFSLQIPPSSIPPLIPLFQCTSASTLRGGRRCSYPHVLSSALQLLY